MTSTIQVSHNAETAHRIPGLAGPGAKCSNVHGHSFWITWTFAAQGFKEVMEGAEFGLIKRTLREWVDKNIDHGYICREDDEVGKFLQEKGLKVYFLGSYPTTEVMAHLFGQKAMELLPHLTLLEVHVQETRVNSATWSPEED